MSLIPNFVNDILNLAVNTKRRYAIKKTSDNSVVQADVYLDDITDYSQEGSTFGATEVNALVKMVGIPVQGTLTAGATTLTLTSEYFTADAHIDFYSDDMDVYPTAFDTSTVGRITMTFDAQSVNCGITLVAKEF